METSATIVHKYEWTKIDCGVSRASLSHFHHIGAGLNPVSCLVINLQLLSSSFPSFYVKVVPILLMKCYYVFFKKITLCRNALLVPGGLNYKRCGLLVAIKTVFMVTLVT